MNCIEFNELLFSYMDEELEDSQKILFENHMKNCASCENEYKAYQKLMSDIHALPMEELPKGYCKKLHGKLEDANINRIKKKRNNFIKYIGIAASCVLVISAIYFTGNNSSDFNQNKIASDNSEQFTTSMGDYDSAKPESNENFDLSDGSTDSNSNLVATQKTASIYRGMDLKIIKNGNLELETLDFEGFVGNVEEIVRNNNGYIEYNETSIRYKTEEKEYKNANIKLRVPQESFDEIVEYIEEQSSVSRKNINESDVTKEYYDTESSLNNLIIQENRLRELFDKATNITDILAIENEIKRVRTEIDSYSINLSNIDDRVSMATIELNVNEVEGKNINTLNSKGIWTKSKEGFARTINGIIDFFESIVVWIISYLPILLPLSIIGFIIYRIVKKKYRNKV